MAFHPVTIDAAGGEYMEAVLVTDWHKAPGDAVARGDLLLTVETAKAATDIEAETDGWLAEICVPEGSEAPVGAVLGRISDVEGETPGAEATPEPVPAPVTAPQTPRAPSPGRVVASPLARRIAAQRDVALDGLTGTGPHGRIKARDVEQATIAEPGPAQPPAARRPAPLVLLHGFGADRTAWAGLRALMPPEIETIALDLPGHGKATDRPETAFSGLIRAISDELDRRGLDEIHLAGHSLGGAVALALAVAGRGAVVRSLTLLAPAGLTPGIDADFLTGLPRAESAEALEVLLHRMVVDPAALPAGFAQAALLQLDRNGNRAALRDMARALFPDGRPAFETAPMLARVEVPLRVIWGRQDRIAPPEGLPPLPGTAALHLLAGTGHVPQLEAPALTARLLTETLRSAG